MLILIVSGCQIKSQYFSPPIFLGIAHIDANSLTLNFDKPVYLSNIELDSQLNLQNYNQQTVYFSNAKAGYAYTLKATARHGITSSDFALQFWGIPEKKPVSLAINELAIIRSKNLSDAVELRVLESGNLEGTTVYLGTPNYYSARFIFKDYPVQKDELIVLNAYKQENLFFENSPTLSNTRGVVTIASNPYDIPYHGIAYEKISASTTHSTHRRSFQQQLLYLIEHNLWINTPVNTEYITATRTLNRKNVPIKIPDNANNWYITQTKGNTIGTKNNPNVYYPKNAPN